MVNRNTCILSDIYSSDIGPPQSSFPKFLRCNMCLANKYFTLHYTSLNCGLERYVTGILSHQQQQQQQCRRTTCQRDRKRRHIQPSINDRRNHTHISNNYTSNAPTGKIATRMRSRQRHVTPPPTHQSYHCIRPALPICPRNYYYIRLGALKNATTTDNSTQNL